jgi:hypothetical protein
MSTNDYIEFYIDAAASETSDLASLKANINLVQGTSADTQTASEVPFTPTGTITSTDVQNAIAEAYTDATVYADGLSGGSVELTVNDVAHTMTALSTAYLDAGTWTTGTSYSDNSLPTYFVTEVVDVDNFKVIRNGAFTSTAHGFASGTYYLQVDGSFSTVKPLYNPIPCFEVIDANTLYSLLGGDSEKLDITKDYEWGEIWVSGVSNLDLSIVTTGAKNFTVDWGDGTITSYASASSVAYNYASAYTGYIKITVDAGVLNEVEEMVFTLDDGIGEIEWSSFFSDFSGIEKVDLSGTGIDSNYGDFSLIAPSLTYADIDNGYFYGDLTGKMNSLLIRLRFTGSNEISVDVSTLPSTLTYLGVTGNSSLYGVIQDNFPVAMTHYDVKGTNTISGDYGLITEQFPAIFTLTGNNQVDDYTTGTVDFSTVAMNVFIHTGSAGYGFSTAEIDQLLIDLSASTWTGGKNLILQGTHAARSAASDAAVTSLEAQGVTVSTN